MHPGGTGVIRVLIVDDQDLVRAGLRMIVETADDIEVVAEAADGETALSLVAEHIPDVVLMDVRMPKMDGVQATAALHRRLPSPPHVLILTTFDSDDVVYSALQAGASGFLLKTAPPDRLIEAVRCVHSGEALLAPSLVKRLIETHITHARPTQQFDDQLAALTSREHEIFVHVGQGLSNAEIATRLTISETTVKSHINRVFAKLGIKDRVQAVVLAYESGVIRVGRAQDSRAT
jgi:DNA-binding NarL/FixJ family response regulator